MPKRKGLGDIVEEALTKIGITSDKITELIGRDCGCKRRREKMNRLGRWLAKVTSGRFSEAREEFQGLLDDYTSGTD